ncbi:Rz1-like lysis system protein LysC [Pseudomonas baltica]|uniref:Rz1-like lysis system protein LysC n=1 Tax=Pseudomonas baltica TaxID=2762576 RepID=UPI0028A0B07A|nr:Rz1-like lysis system protein LysC [Pseudomonas baltica]
MKTKNCRNGLTSLCLMLLAACASAPPSPAQLLIETGCPAVIPCTLGATGPRNNGALLTDAEAVEADWAACAAQVDMIYEHQVKQAKAK